ncbi:MAG: SUMF1/EgtB/PvdO family nonheme iron enzyme [Bacteroidales bacterium]|nr:SUMF1/EgtB/PvdO family nonheme iron enzyme [Bacteroidales bacterium]MBN2764556.1 SUMF1/EgtB/PvdO family nonheme iron enzyme [Bacteroidales bacterium]
MNVKFSAVLKIFLVAVIVTACGKKGSQVSSTTGWDYNDPENGGFEVITGSEQETGPGLVLIEGGTFTMGRVEQDVMYDWNNVPRRVTVSSFYMDQTEVRNVDYREYLHWIHRVFIDYPLVYKKALPDTLVWRRPMAYNEPYVQYYFRHPSYNEYPAVGVNWLQASDYAAWRTDRVNEGILIREGILKPDPNQLNETNFNTEAYLVGQYEGLVNQNLRSLDPNQEFRQVMLEDGMLLPKYRLPTEAEWEYAALALIGNTYEERVYERRIYPWDGHNVRNDVKKYRGEMRANFVRGRGDMMGTAGGLNDNASIPAPVESYWPNDFGLYCMAGNVNEWVEDVYRPLTFEDFNEFNPFRGNVFQTLLTDEEGNVAEKDSLGRLRYRDVTEAESINRWNYKKAYYKNYKDGDYESSLIDGNDWSADAATQSTNSQRMYSQQVGYETSLISDKTRVYKGGSWRDRAYWLSPGTRRYLDEEQSRDDLGFRCAMTRVGSPAGY